MIVEDQSATIAFLADPASHGGVAVERIDTHGATVFLAGTRAYKVKRAVRYPYMDFSTLELRRVNCEREVALNRRTAPDLYLGVEAVVRAADGRLSLGGPGEAIEWTVVMKRFDQDGLCDRLARAGRLTPELMGALAEAIAAFHGAAERLAGAAEHLVGAGGGGAAGGGAAGLGAVIAENLAELSQRPELFPAAEVAAFERASGAALGRLAPLLDQRLEAGFVRRCHGDLHLRNIVLYQGKPVPVDALEFDENLATIDTLYDLAFLIMDLTLRGLRGEANLLLNRYIYEYNSAQNIYGLIAMPLFLACRAGIRAMVHAQRAAQLDGEAASESKYQGG